jgi:hypothetical protein
LEIFDGSDENDAATATPLRKPFVTAIHEGLVVRCTVTRKQGATRASVHGKALFNPLSVFNLDDEPSSSKTSRREKNKESPSAVAAAALSVNVKKCDKMGQNCYHASLSLRDLNSERFERSEGFLGKLKVKGHRTHILQDSGINPTRLIPF